MSGFGQVAVVGAGWAGLACAAELAAAGLPVTVFEASRRVGGRARSVDLDGHLVDNGQHLLVGADPERLLLRLPLRLDYPGAFRLQLPTLPAPWHLAGGLLAADGATLREKLSAALFMTRLKARRYRLDADRSVAAWLDREGQTGTLRRFLWEPLCLAALNTPPADASAQIFANVLRDSLGGAAGATDLLLQRRDLGEIFAEPAAQFVANRGGTIRRSTRLHAADIERDGNGWRVAGEHCEHLVLAVAPQHLAPLLQERPAHAALLQQLAGYAYEPIGTLYLAYPDTVRLPFPMLGLRGPLGQWVFDRGRLGGPPGQLACVLS
ncbi:MAG TPA: hydroxysqualene dehydroxylase HpnE, partial [Azospira sp.]|nr:hydroxysqualene dehydroxylase HpnE [Azospira sp.]